MTGIIRGADARRSRADANPYEQGIRELSTVVEKTLAFAYLYRRLSDQVSNSVPPDLDVEPTGYYREACFGMLVANLSVLLERDKRTWNFGALIKEWRRYANNQAQEDAIKRGMASLDERLKDLKHFRDTMLAHLERQPPGPQTIRLTAPPEKLDWLQDVVDLMDEFVIGSIPYSLGLHEAEETDLRILLGLQ